METNSSNQQYIPKLFLRNIIYLTIDKTIYLAELDHKASISKTYESVSFNEHLMAIFYGLSLIYFFFNQCLNYSKRKAFLFKNIFVLILIWFKSIILRLNNFHLNYQQGAMQANEFGRSDEKQISTPFLICTNSIDSICSLREIKNVYSASSQVNILTRMGKRVLILQFTHSSKHKRQTNFR